MNAPPTTDHPSTGMMVGISTGKDGVHDAHKQPFGTARFFLAADDMRRQLGAEGILFIGDQRDKKNLGRIPREKRLARVLAPEMKIMTEDQLDKPTLERVDEEMNAGGITETLRSQAQAKYFKWQTRVVAGLLLSNGFEKKSKYGWEVDGMGERQFDQILLPEWQIQCHYGPGDLDVDGKWAVPYLLNTKEPEKRVCIPLRDNGISAELNKIKPGICRATYKTWHATARIVLGKEDRSVLHTSEFATNPLPEGGRDPVTNGGEISALKDLLNESLAYLLRQMADVSLEA
ncbi:hypothetical protein HZA87_05745 [Candidatus Uhrbacteria bacterium]|nr:hypothetical protein [Candidatus Uhrbacteria bacterium]